MTKNSENKGVKTTKEDPRDLTLQWINFLNHSTQVLQWTEQKKSADFSAVLRRAFSQSWSMVMSISCVFLLLLYPFNLVFVQAINIEPKEITLDGGKRCF